MEVHGVHVTGGQDGLKLHAGSINADVGIQSLVVDLGDNAFNEVGGFYFRRRGRKPQMLGTNGNTGMFAFGAVHLKRQFADLDAAVAESGRKNVFHTDESGNKRRGGLYYACWVDQGLNPGTEFIFLFIRGHVPWIGRYRVLEHTREFEVKFATLDLAAEFAAADLENWDEY